ncbi:hypothetical protein D9M68_292220 [compost metagenome]
MVECCRSRERCAGKFDSRQVCERKSNVFEFRAGESGATKLCFLEVDIDQPREAEISALQFGAGK